MTADGSPPTGRRELADRLGGEYEPALPPSLQPPDSNWWWLPVAVVATALPAVGLLVLLAVTVPSVRTSLPTWGQLGFGLYWSMVVGNWLFSPIALHYDRRYVLAHAGWTPSLAYYAVVVPGVGTVVALAYVFARLRRVGVRA